MSAAANGGSIDAELGIKTVVEPGVHADAGGVLSDASRPAVQLRRCHGPRCDAASGVGKAPGGGRIPDILYRRIVVHRDSHDQAVTGWGVIGAEGEVLRIADVGVVEAETVADAVIGELNEGA